MTIKIPSAVFFLTFYCGAIQHPGDDLVRLTWLKGTWENSTRKGILYESWKKISEHELAAISYMLKGKDTVLFESMRIVQEKKTLAFISTVENQNNNLPVRFVMTAITDTSVVFENPAHDFPQIISYMIVGQDSLVAEISGMLNSTLQKRSFPMKKQHRSTNHYEHA